MRHARSRVDDNHARIVTGLRAAGCSVQSLADLGRGCPDLLVGLRGRNWLLEIKNPDQPPNKRRLTPDEQGWHETWRGQVAVAETLEDALQVITYHR